MPIDWDDDLPDAPSEAFVNEQDFEVDDAWLASADPGEQVAAMVAWFGARFCDPAEETPYMSSEGGYLWIHGGPFDAGEQLSDRFAPTVEDDVIEKAVAYIERDGTHEWAPTFLTYYDDFFDVESSAHESEPLARLHATLGKLAEVLQLSGSDEAQDVARTLAFSGVIAALETFLWETMNYWVDHSEQTVQRLIERHPLFRDRPIKLGSIYRLFPALRNEVKAHMQNIVWHRAEPVSQMFKYGLDVTLGYTGFDDAIKLRHDIVHRSGKDVDGRPVTITNADVVGLIDRVQTFALAVENKILDATSSIDETFEGANDLPE